MKSKILLFSTVSVMAAGAALHIGHEPPADGVCPLGKMIHGKQTEVSVKANVQSDTKANHLLTADNQIEKN